MRNWAQEKRRQNGFRRLFDEWKRKLMIAFKAILEQNEAIFEAIVELDKINASQQWQQ